MVLFPDAPSAQPWELVLVDKIFQKGGNGAQGISRFLQRHVRSSDATPPGAILRSDFRRTIAELNVACDEASYDAVAAACAYKPPRGGIASRDDPTHACLSVRELAARLANIAQSGSGISAVYAPVENSPMTGFATARVPASTRREARAKASGVNDPDYYPNTRGLPSSPRAPAASSDPNNMLYDNPAGGGDFVGSPGRREARVENEDEFEFVGSPPAKSSFDSPGRDSQSGMGGFGNLRIDVPGDDEPLVPMSPRSPRGMTRLSPARGDGFNGDAPLDDAALASPDRAAISRNEQLRARFSKQGVVSEKSVTPLFEYPSEHFASHAFPSLDTVEAVEEAMRAALLTRTSSRAAAMRLVAGMHPQGGRLRTGDALNLEQFKLAMRRVNVMPASDKVTEAVFRKHDLDGNGSLDYQEFIRYLMPSDFEPVSPSVYRASYPGYTKAAPSPRRRAEKSFLTQNRETVTPAGAVPRDRDARMHALDPRDANSGKATAGAPTYEHGAFIQDPTHDLTTRRAEAAMLDKLRGENGGDATTRHFVDAFKFFDDDGVGVLDVVGFRRALRRLNVDPSESLFRALVARHETAPGSGLVDYRAMAARVVPPSAQETERREKADGRVGERWGAEGTDRLWAGYDRVRLESSLAKLQEPSVFDRGRAGDAGYVPLISDIRELEALLREKTLERTSNSGKGARAWWKYFDRDGSGAMDRGEFETAMARFNIAAAPEVVEEIMRKYDSNGDGEIDYCEMLRCLVPEGVRDRQRDTVASMRNMRHFGTSDVTVEASGGAVKAPQLTLGAPRPATAEEATHRVSVSKFQRLLLEWMRARGRGLAGLRKLFRQMDGDGDGCLDHDEFTRGLAMMNIHPDPGDLAAILARYDANGDGSIQFDEFIARVLPEHEVPGYEEGNWQSIAHHDPKPANILPTNQGLYAVDFDNLLQQKIMSKADKMGSARQVFRDLDYDRSGFVSPQEFRKWLTAMNFFPDEDAFQKLWRRYDPEGKGLIDYDHFVRRVTPRHDPTKSVF